MPAKTPPHPASAHGGSAAELGHPLPAGERKSCIVRSHLFGEWQRHNRYSSPQRGEGGRAKRRPGEGVTYQSALKRLGWFAAAALFVATSPTFASPLPAGFVRLADVDPTIQQSMNYAGANNFIGRVVKGYEAPACILTEKAATALAQVQKRLSADNLTLVVFDCYRPERAVKDFVDWIGAGGPPDPKWHPNVRRENLIKQGYIASRSAHSRGSTVDVGLARFEQANADVEPNCGASFPHLLEFGSGYDCLDSLAHTAHTPLPADAPENRRRLVEAMAAEGFRNYAKEWWHFTLNGEPFKSGFDFPVTAE